MTSVLRICRKCAGEIPADAPEGLCTACLLETGLGFFAEDEVGQPVEVGSAPQAGVAARMLADFGDYELLEEIGRGGQGVVLSRAAEKS